MGLSEFSRVLLTLNLGQEGKQTKNKSSPPRPLLFSLYIKNRLCWVFVWLGLNYEFLIILLMFQDLEEVVILMIMVRGEVVLFGFVCLFVGGGVVLVLILDNTESWFVCVANVMPYEKWSTAIRVLWHCKVSCHFKYMCFKCWWRCRRAFTLVSCLSFFTSLQKKLQYCSQYLILEEAWKKSRREISTLAVNS